MRLLLLLALAALACRTAADAPQGAVIPRWQGVPDTSEGRYLEGLKYDPADRALAWEASGRLVVEHRETYSSHDVYGSTCGGSGLFAVYPDDTSRAPAPIATGSPACRLLSHTTGVSLRPGGREVAVGGHIPVNDSRVVRYDLITGDTAVLPAPCDDPWGAVEPAWSPTGDHLVFTSGCGHPSGREALFLSRPDGSAARRIAPEDTVGEEQPAWSADGRWIAFVQYVGSVSAPAESVTVMDTSGRGRRTLAAGFAPAWSPDGQWIAFLAPRSGGDEAIDRSAHDLRVVRIADGTVRTVFTNRVRSTYSRGWGPMREGEPLPRLVWSPDGQSIAFSRAFDAGTSVWRVRVSDGQLGRVTRSPGR